MVALPPAKDRAQEADEPVKETVVSKEDLVKPQPVPLVSLEETTKKPAKISGAAPSFPLSLKRTYAGRRATVQALLLVDHKGDVVEVKIDSSIPGAIKKVLINNYKTWKYKPGLKDETVVKVWLPVKYKLFFKF